MDFPSLSDISLPFFQFICPFVFFYLAGVFVSFILGRYFQVFPPSSPVRCRTGFSIVFRVEHKEKHTFLWVIKNFSQNDFDESSRMYNMCAMWSDLINSLWHYQYLVSAQELIVKYVNKKCYCSKNLYPFTLFTNT